MGITLVNTDGATDGVRVGPGEGNRVAIGDKVGAPVWAATGVAVGGIDTTEGCALGFVVVANLVEGLALGI